MAEYIRREDAIKCIEGQCVDGKMWGNDESEGTLIEAYSAIDDLMDIPAADVTPVRHGRWILEAHDERVNYRWNVTAECSECCNEKKEIWAGFFAYIVPSIARSVALTSAKRVKLSNYCPYCGAKLDLEEAQNGK